MSKKRGNQTVNEANPIRKDPDIMGLLSRLPQETASSLTDTQLQHIKVAVGSGQYRKHKVDLRGTIPLPFSAYRLYFVFLRAIVAHAVLPLTVPWSVLAWYLAPRLKVEQSRRSKEWRMAKSYILCSAGLLIMLRCSAAFARRDF